MADSAIAWTRAGKSPSHSITAAGRWFRALRIGAPVLAAATFNMALCFLNTRGVSISVIHVELAEIAIIGTVLLISRRVVLEQMLAALVILFSYLCVHWLFVGEVDPKIVRDLLIPFAFFALGRSAADQEDADRIVYALLLLVLAVGLVEWLNLATFLRYFDVIGYYVDKGTVEIAQTRYLPNHLFASGMRPDGRSLFPALGDHRVSSIFLEPVSAGNFAAIAFFWVACRFRRRPAMSIFFALVCGVLIVLADARFAAGIAIAAVLAQLLPVARSRTALFALPALVILLLLGIAWKLDGAFIDNSLIGRLHSSGMVLWSFEPLQWLGLARGRADALTLDSGYSYLLSNVGVVGVAALWLVLVATRAATPQAQMLRSCIALYAALSLSISASMFTIKTAALLWFLYGASQNDAQGTQSAGMWRRSAPHRRGLLLNRRQAGGGDVSLAQHGLPRNTMPFRTRFLPGTDAPEP
jgi:putative polymerase